MSVGCACAESVALIQPRPSIQVIRVKKKKRKPPTGHYARGYGQKNDGRTKRDSKTFPIVGARRTLARSRAAALLPIKEALLCRVVLLLRLCVLRRRRQINRDVPQAELRQHTPSRMPQIVEIEANKNPQDMLSARRSEVAAPDCSGCWPQRVQNLQERWRRYHHSPR